MEVNKGQLAPEIDRALVDMAEAAWRRTAWRRGRSNSPIFKALSLLTDYGFGLGRIAVVASVTVLVFAFAFYMADQKATVVGSFLVSAHYFLGLEDDYAASSELLSLIGNGEALLGLLFLAVIIAVFTSKFTDL